MADTTSYITRLVFCLFIFLKQTSGYDSRKNKRQNCRGVTPRNEDTYYYPYIRETRLYAYD